MLFTSEMRARLVDVGWEVAEVRSGLLTLEGRDLGGESVQVARDALRGTIVFIPSGVDDRAERWMPLGTGGAVARRIAGDGTIRRAEVANVARGRAELERLLRNPPRGENGLPHVIATYEAEGWSIDHDASSFTNLDEPSWQLCATRSGELLRLAMTLGPGGDAEIRTDTRGGVEFGGYRASARVSSLPEAESLLDALSHR